MNFISIFFIFLISILHSISFFTILILLLSILFQLSFSYYDLPSLHNIHNISVNADQEKDVVLNIESLGHAALLFVNKRLIGEKIIHAVTMNFTFTCFSMINNEHHIMVSCSIWIWLS